MPCLSRTPSFQISFTRAALSEDFVADDIRDDRLDDRRWRSKSSGVQKGSCPHAKYFFDLRSQHLGQRSTFRCSGISPQIASGVIFTQPNFNLEGYRP
jgi:hypothetical protein